MKILVTGGTGLLGGRLIPKLVEDGHQIFALTRSASSHDKLKALGASPRALLSHQRRRHRRAPQGR
jgi:uncharacterized protein YbjT (DUF2867 family)